ncbi:hypothetical protein [Pseudomonas nunensis]|uniref:Uncharacterized protein n=1 Tax=Pseudomonas nunensis TaxID=2961896 RepID=A0ABY5EFH6_9PSED|nr:hypothetical protein [Pseudomonas nunensis]MCL5226039.1 hypothetical protein [Pseudomonas nunensis]UTO14018.1 hypothetical protein NK667_28285 [Pseudomonas nunensis]
MSNSSMKAVYFSYPSGFLFSVDTMNENSGRFSGQFQKRNNNVELVSGGFNFYNSQNRTDLVFSSNTDDWSLTAPYSNGAPFFESWSVRRTSKSNAADFTDMEFNMDLSGQGGSWFGSTDWWGTGKF